MSVSIIKNQWELFDQLKDKLIRCNVNFRITPKAKNVVFNSIPDFNLFERIYKHEIKNKEKEVMKK